MRERLAVGALLALAAFLTGCSDFVISPIGTNSAGLLVLTLDYQGNYTFLIEGDESPKLYLTDSHGSFLKEIPISVETGFIGWPQLTPDGRKVIYLAAEETHKEEFLITYTKVDRWGIHQVDLESGADELLLETENYITSLQLEPTGKWLAYLEVSEELECPQTGSIKLFDDSKLYILPLNEPGAQPREIASGALAYRWSRDGGSLLLIEEEFSWCTQSDGDEGQPKFILASLNRYDFPEGEEEPEWERLTEILSDSAFLFAGLIFPQMILDWTGEGRVFIALAPPILGAWDPDKVSWQLYSFDSGSDEAAFIADRAFYPAVSPNVPKLAFIEETDPYYCQRTIWLIEPNDPDVQPRWVAGLGCYTQLFWASESELGCVEEAEDAIIWIYDLRSGQRFNLSEALARRWGER